MDLRDWGELEHCACENFPFFIIPLSLFQTSNVVEF